MKTATLTVKSKDDGGWVSVRDLDKGKVYEANKWRFDEDIEHTPRIFCYMACKWWGIAPGDIGYADYELHNPVAIEAFDF